MERIERETDQPESLEERQGEHADPVKQHGDALLEGNGTRHGVDDRNERPIKDRSADNDLVTPDEGEDRP